MNSTTSTVPGRQTRCRSLRPRSTSMTCSERSLGSASSSSARRTSSSGGLASRARAGDRVRDRPLAGHPDERLRAAADDGVRRAVRVREPEEVHVGAGVAGAQGPVDVERVGRAVEREPLRENDLEHLAGADVLLGQLDDLLVPLPRGVGAHAGHGVVDREPVDDGDRAVGRSRERPGHRVEPLDGIRPGELDPLVGVVVVDRVGDEQDRAVGVVVAPRGRWRA